jgi:biotin transport system permease protein
MVRNTVFKYKAIRGILHEVPALIKLILLLPLSFVCMYLPLLWLGAGIASAVIAAFICGLSLQDQLTDFKPVFYYAVLMYALSAFSNFLTDNFRPSSASQFLTAFIPNNGYLRITLRLFLIVQISALFFRTTTSLEIREALRLEIISLFLCFIPEIFKIWTTVNLAWKSRGGKDGFGKIKTLLFILISLSFEKAAIKAKALEARS